MKGKQAILWGLAWMMAFAALQVNAQAMAGELAKAPGLKVMKVSVGLQSDPKGEALFSYEMDPETGCIQNITDKQGKIPASKEPPKWLVKGKKIEYLGNLGDMQCQQGIIGVSGSPIEYWYYIPPEGYVCIGAWDPCNNMWYPRCGGPYIPCP